jgi:hypothetical protein
VVAATSPITFAAGTVAFDQSANNTTNDARYARLGAANAFTVGGHTITNTVVGAEPLSITLASGQTANAFAVRNSSATVQSWFDNTGANLFLSSVRPRSTPTTGSFLALNSNQTQVTQQTAGAVAFIVKGAASQSANLQQWQSSAGSILALVDAFGGAAFGGNNALSSSLGVQTAGNPAQKGITVRGAASQTAFLTEWQNSATNVLAYVAASGAFVSTGNIEGGNGLAQIRANTDGGMLQMTRSSNQPANPGANVARIYLRTGTNAGTLKLVVRAGAAGAETTILDNIPQ